MQGKYKARIGYDKKKYEIGTYDREEDAARCYDLAAVRLQGMKATTNFEYDFMVQKEDPDEILAVIDKRSRVVYRVPRQTEFIGGTRRGEEKEFDVATMVISSDEDRKSLGLDEAETIVPPPRPANFDPAPHKQANAGLHAAASDVASVGNDSTGEAYAGKPIPSGLMLHETCEASLAWYGGVDWSMAHDKACAVVVGCVSSSGHAEDGAHAQAGQAGARGHRIHTVSTRPTTRLFTHALSHEENGA